MKHVLSGHDLWIMSDKACRRLRGDITELRKTKKSTEVMRDIDLDDYGHVVTTDVIWLIDLVEATEGED